RRRPGCARSHRRSPGRRRARSPAADRPAPAAAPPDPARRHRPRAPIRRQAGSEWRWQQRAVLQASLPQCYAVGQPAVNVFENGEPGVGETAARVASSVTILWHGTRLARVLTIWLVLHVRRRQRPCPSYTAAGIAVPTWWSSC